EGLTTSQQLADALRDSIQEGADRKKIALLESHYRPKNPSTPAKLTARQRDELYENNVNVRAKARKVGATNDVSMEFRFAYPLLTLRGKVVYAREARRDDFAASGASTKGSKKPE